MARVVVTGSSGKLGRAVVEDLAAHGYDLVTVDQDRPEPGQPGHFTKADLGKAVEEEMARHFARWNPELSIIGLRFSNVMAPEGYAAFPAWQDDPARRRWNLWGYIDARDGAQAVRRSLETELPGFNAFVIANADTVMERPSAELMAELYPDVPLRRPLVGTETLLGIDKARSLLGYEPRHSWLDQTGVGQ